MKKRVLSLLLAVLIVLALVPPAEVRAAEIVASGDCGAEGDNVTWSLDSAGTLTIRGTGAIENYGSNSFGKRQAPWKPWRYNLSGESGVVIKKVVITEGITAIGDFAFEWCSEMTEISIPNSVTSIGNGSFSTCQSLHAVFLPKNLTEIGESAFEHCDALSTVTIPAKVTTLGASAFASCDNLESVTISGPISTIWLYTFRECRKLSDITLPASLQTIKAMAFSGTPSLKNIYFGGSQIQWDTLVKNSDKFLSANVVVHYGQTGPSPTVTPSPSPTPSAKPTIPPDAEASGTCGADGDNLVWWVKDGTLTIAGEGEMEDYSFTEKLIPPWMGSAMEIKKVLVEDGPTSIGAEAFYLLTQCSEIFLGKDIRSVRRGALCAGSASLWLSVIFEGDPPEVLDEAAFPDKATIYYKTGAEALESDWVNAAVKHFYAFDISKTDKIDRQVSVYPRWVYQEDKAINKLDIDNTWNFTNNAPDWPDAEANKGYFITRSNYNKLLQFVSRSDKKSLTTSSAKAEVFKKKTNFNIDGIAPDGYYEWWNGSCYGMAVTVAAAMNHCIVPSMLPGSSGTLFSIEEGKTSIHISRMTQSLINFYHMQQNLKAVQDKSRAITQCERQMEQLIMLDKTVREAEADGRGVVISFDMRHRVPGENGSLAYSTVGHTVTGYAVEDGIFPMYLNGQYYIFYHRVLTYDPAYSGDKQKDYDFALYYNDTVWAIPGWGADDQFDAIWALSTDKGISLGIFTPTRTDNCAQLTGLLADDNFINAIDYRTGLCNYTSKGRGASPSTPGYLRTSAQNLTLTIDGQEVEIKDSLFGGTTTVSDTGAMILFPSNGVGDGSYTIVLPEGAEYSIAAEEDFACSFETDDFYLSAGVQGAGRASFTPSGTVDLNVSGSAPVYASLTANNSPTWHNFEVASPDAGHLLLELTDNGLEIWGDDLRDTAVTAYDQEEDAKQANFTASEGNVLVTDENEELVIMTDPDGDGVYDVPLEDQEPIPPAALQFSDVKPTDYFYHAVAWAVAQGITGGTSSTTFSPGNTCTREQIMTFLWAANGRTEPSGMAEFDDMPKNTAFQKAISWAVEKKITAGTGGNKFGSKSSCTRGQAMVFLWTAAGRPEPSQIASFADMPDNSVFQKAISWAKEEGITSGTSATTFSPNKPCTRAQIMTFLYHVYQ